MKNLSLVFIVLSLTILVANAQKYDSIIHSSEFPKTRIWQCHKFEGITACYSKPRPFAFVTQLPGTFSDSFRATFSKKSLPALSVIGLSTLALILFDQDITDKTQNFSKRIDLNNQIVYTNVIGFNMGSKYIPVYQAPRNFNTAIYSLGEGFTSVVLSGGLFAYGKFKHDNRSLQTASQIIQAQFAVGLFAQVIKRISGRESPRVSTAPGGTWRPFASFSAFQNHTSHYDAFPSGHLASMMATITVLALNYPEKKWIKPIAYALTGIVGYAMVNNGVHWAGDYPLALGIGYLCGRTTASMNRLVNHSEDMQGTKQHMLAPD